MFSTLSIASTSGSVRLRTENFWILVFVISKSENRKFPFPPKKNTRMRTLINGENIFNGIHEKSRNENIIVNVQILENGTFPFSLFRIPKTRIQKFSILSNRSPHWRKRNAYFPLNWKLWMCTFNPFPIELCKNCRNLNYIQNESDEWVNHFILLIMDERWWLAPCYSSHAGRRPSILRMCIILTMRNGCSAVSWVFAINYGEENCSSFFLSCSTREIKPCSTTL